MNVLVELEDISALLAGNKALRQRITVLVNENNTLSDVIQTTKESYAEMLDIAKELATTIGEINAIMRDNYPWDPVETCTCYKCQIKRAIEKALDGLEERAAQERR